MSTNNGSNVPLSESNLSAHDSVTDGGSAPARRDSMPELRSSSNSSASSVSDSGTPPLAPFLAAQNFQQDDGDEAWEDDDAPSITIGSRRARPGNDSGDADRDRRPPAQRTGEMHQTSRPTSGRQISGQRTQPRHPPTAQPHPPNVHFQNTIPVSPGDIHGLFGGIMNAFGGAIQGQGAPVMHFTQELPPGSPNVQQWFTNLFAGLGSQPEHSDPARARRMVRLLEPVPEGLVQRLQRLQEIGQAEEGDLMCAVCWESLLSEGGGFADVASGERNENEMQGVQNTPPADNDNEEDTGELPKIVTLPCSHTFHSSCLLPWFSQPRGTTCPTCRFELDPNGDLTARLPTPAGGQGFATVQPPWRPVRMTPGGPAPRINRGDSSRRGPPTTRPSQASSSSQPRPAMPRPSSSMASPSSRRSSGPFNPAAVGLNNANPSSGIFTPPTGLFRGFFDNVASGSGASHGEDAPPQLIPITPPVNPTAADEPSSPSMMDIDDPAHLEGGYDPDLPFLPTRPPSRAMQDELMREMARAYASRMAELVFDEQRGHHHHHHHHDTEFVELGGYVGVPMGAGMPGPETTDGVDFVMDDTQGNVLGTMSLTFGHGGPPPELATPQPRGSGHPPLSNHPRPTAAARNSTAPSATSSTRTSNARPSPNTASGPGTSSGNPGANVINPPPDIASGLQNMLAGVFRSAGIPINADQINIATVPLNVPVRPPTTGGGEAQRPPQAQPSSNTQAERERRRREWVPPEPTAPTFRAKVEQKERATGMRCWDMSCGIGPSDDDPASTSAQAVSSTPQIRIRKNSSSALPSSGKGKEREEDHGPVEYACEHSFHPSCLVSATRVALSVRGVSVEPERDEQSGDVHLHCPVCRVDGVVDSKAWEEGISALD